MHDGRLLERLRIGIMRAYTLDEIDSMRKSVQIIHNVHRSQSWQIGQEGFREAVFVQQIEEYVRTYMAAGIEPRDLQDKALGIPSAA